ncbi:MAG TPA: ATP synthase F1 subunit delta [Caldithrix abyssi]|uniref:ATP synthase subunit delta n=1 Tax=Caldithrix abyssi TaxID=187145 RepID=A0A7V5PMR6_CALAY|nr:ATP synthase F1 subunit delta [Caldithrix abyssi]
MSRVAKRYAKALFELAQEQKLLSQVQADLQHIRTVIEQSPEFVNLLKNPLITENEKAQLMRPLFEGKVSRLTLNFLELLSQKRRTEFLDEVIESFEQMVLEAENKVEGEVVSAVKLTSQQLTAIKQRIEELTGKTLLLQERIDRQILGGFIVRVKDMVIDNSIRYQLEKLRERLATR